MKKIKNFFKAVAKQFVKVYGQEYINKYYQKLDDEVKHFIFLFFIQHNLNFQAYKNPLYFHF